jgi:hypothetical protein
MKSKNLSEIKTSLSSPSPAQDLSVYAKALWYAGKGDWDKAHTIVQDLEDQPSALIHAFLHRQEGDLSNAGYWYAKARSNMPDISLDEEWNELALRFF